jgi:hypothetical protein
MQHGVSPHNYRHLIARWKIVARRAGLRMRPLVKIDGDQHFYLETPAAQTAEPIYISAGIHGDEPASTEALLAWAEKEAPSLRDWPLLLFPCLNPWGLRNNIRTDCNGVDLNRAFHTDHPLVLAVKNVVGTRRMRLSVHLHEDYDGEGIYIYEASRNAVWAEDLLKAASRWLPVDLRKKIDISRAKNGIVRRRLSPRRFEKLGYPESVWLFLGHTDHIFTIETPSEYALERRVSALVATLGAIARRVLR